MVREHEPLRPEAKSRCRHRFPLLMYSAIMATHSTLSPSLAILVVILVLAAGYFGGRNYVNRRFNRRNWK